MNTSINYHQSTPHEILSEIRGETAKTILIKNRSPDVPFSRAIDPYVGCEHRCVYCFSRPTPAQSNSSSKLDVETNIIYKANAVQLLEEAILSSDYKCQPIVLGVNTDPYQPAEKKTTITRQLLEVFEYYNHPFSIVTKGSLVLRDLDILKRMSKDQLCSVRISVSTLDNRLAQRLEPRTDDPDTRLSTIRALNHAGIPVGALVAPIIPKINDHEVEELLGTCAKAGASHAAFIFIRLPHEIKPLFREWLITYYPRRAEHIMSLIKENGEGKGNDIQQRFQLACLKYGLNSSETGKLNRNLFNSPNLHRQLSLI